jgi:hypothetical protein
LTYFWAYANYSSLIYNSKKNIKIVYKKVAYI